jgi:nitric oxide reductase NorQ protein
MELAVEKYKVTDEPFYLPIGQEVELFEAAFAAKLPAMLKGPTGGGKLSLEALKAQIKA